MVMGDTQYSNKRGREGGQMVTLYLVGSEM